MPKPRIGHLLGDSLPIVDAHAHFWDLDAHNYPWLRDPDPIPFRYDDYSAIRHNYLPEDYRRDTRDFTVAGMVHIDTVGVVLNDNDFEPLFTESRN